MDEHAMAVAKIVSAIVGQSQVSFFQQNDGRPAVKLSSSNADGTGNAVLDLSDLIDYVSTRMGKSSSGGNPGSRQAR